MRGLDIVLLTIILLILLGAVPVLAVFQIQWLEQVSLLEEQRLTDELTEASLLFRFDLQSEIATLRNALRNAARAYSRDDAIALQENLQFWRENTRFDRLVTQVHIVDFRAQGFPRVRRLVAPFADFEERDPQQLPDTFSLSSLESARQTGGFQSSVARFFSERGWLVEPVYPGSEAGQFAEGSTDRATAAMVISLDLRYLHTGIIPTLFRAYVDPGREYTVRVWAPNQEKPVYQALAGGDDGEPSGEPDLLVTFLDPRRVSVGELELDDLSALGPARSIQPPDNLDTLSIRYWLYFSGLRATGERSVIRLPNATRRALDRAEQSGPTIVLSLGHDELYQLAITHRAGSLSQAVLLQRLRNIAISLGILALLSLALIVLLLLYRRARQLTEQEREFIASVTHELRTPLAVMYSAGENLSSGLVRTEEQARRYGQLITKEGKRLGSMVEQVLMYSGLSGSPGTRTWEAIDVKEFVEELVHKAQSRDQAGHATIRYVVPARMPPLFADRTALESALENLLTNAMKYGGDQIWVTARDVSEPKRGTEIAVADNGPGVPKREQNAIFEPFYHGPRRRPDMKGTGLGLSLVRKIAAYHGGSIEVESPYTQPSGTQTPGARFRFFIPMQNGVS